MTNTDCRIRTGRLCQGQRPGRNACAWPPLHGRGKALKRPGLAGQAEQHAQASLPHIESGSYEGEHWLATFAVQMLGSR